MEGGKGKRGWAEVKTYHEEKKSKKEIITWQKEKEKRVMRLRKEKEERN